MSEFDPGAYNRISPYSLGWILSNNDIEPTVAAAFLGVCVEQIYYWCQNGAPIWAMVALNELDQEVHEVLMSAFEDAGVNVANWLG